MLRKWLKAGFRGSSGATPQKQSALIEKEIPVIKVIYETKGLWDTEFQQNFHEIQIPNAGQNLEPGEPSLPQEGLYVAIPEGSKIIDIKVGNTQKKTFKLEKKVKPAPTATKDKRASPEFTPNQEIYDTDNAFPGVLFKNLGVERLGDIHVVHIMMYPVQYFPRSDKIDLYTRIELEISYELGAEKAPPMRGAPMRGGEKKRVPSGYEDQVLNFDNV